MSTQFTTNNGFLVVDLSGIDLHNFFLTSGNLIMFQTSQILLNNLYNLANNPDEQEKAAEEAKDLLSTSGELTSAAFNSSTYLRACIKESFRFVATSH